MKLMLILVCLCLLAACDAAGPGFRGADKVVREVDGSRFTLRFRGDMVEAIRTSPEMLPRFETVARRAALLAEAEPVLRPDRPAWPPGRGGGRNPALREILTLGLAKKRNILWTTPPNPPHTAQIR